MRQTTDTRVKKADVQRVIAGHMSVSQDELAVEEPLEIRLNDRAYAVTMRTPGQDEALAAGFLATEGILASRDDIWDIARCADGADPDALNIVSVTIAPDRLPAEYLSGRQAYASSSCGLCGRASIAQVRRKAAPLSERGPLSRQVVLGLPHKLRGSQQVFSRTGGLHAAGLFSSSGELLFLAEDIGRHNAVDAVIGMALLREVWPLTDAILMVSGRAGFEIVQKALVAGVGTLCSVSAPSSLAVELARESGMVLIGFLRGESMNIYSGADRVQA